MPSRLRFLPLHDLNVLLISATGSADVIDGATVGEYASLLDGAPEISTYAPLTDIRRLLGNVGLDDLHDISQTFRRTRIRLGRDPYLTKPQAILRDGGLTSEPMAEMIRSAQAHPDLVLITRDPGAAWAHVAGEAQMPPDARQFLGLGSFWSGWFGS